MHLPYPDVPWKVNICTSHVIAESASLTVNCGRLNQHIWIIPGRRSGTTRAAFQAFARLLFLYQRYRYEQKQAAPHDSIGQWTSAFASWHQPRHDILGNMAKSCIKGWTVPPRRILPEAPLPWRVATIGIHDNLTTSQTWVPLRVHRLQNDQLVDEKILYVHPVRGWITSLITSLITSYLAIHCWLLDRAELK